MTMVSGRKRQRLGEGGEDHRKTRPYTDSERLILQEAACMLNVHVDDLLELDPGRQQASGISALDTHQCYHHAGPNSQDPIRFPTALDVTQSLWTKSNGARDAGLSNYGLGPSPPQLSQILEPTDSQLASHWAGSDPSGILVESRPTATIEPVLPLLVTDDCDSNGFTSTSPRDSIPQSTYDGVAIWDERYSSFFASSGHDDYYGNVQGYFDNFGLDSQCLLDSEWFPILTPQAQLAQPALSASLGSPPLLRRAQVDHSVMPDFNRVSFVDDACYPDPLGTSNICGRLSQGISSAVSFPDLLPSQIGHPINGGQLVSRSPSPDAIPALVNNNVIHNRQGEPVLEVLTAMQEDIPPPEPNTSSPSGRPAVNKMIIFMGPSIPPSEGQKPRVKKPFQDPEKRKETGETRKTGACVRCKMQRIRCTPAAGGKLYGPSTPCGPCANISGPTFCRLPCARFRITDSRLFDKGEHPQFRWSRRWPSWDLVEIDTWASSETKTIVLTQDVLGGLTFEIRCREFVPVEGDPLARTWKKNGEAVYYQRSPYAVLSMKETGNEIKKFVANNTDACIKHYIMVRDDRLLSSTYAMAYAMAFRPNEFAENEECQRLLQEVFQLWVAIRMESQPERIVGEETLGMEPQTFDKDVTSYGTNSIPPIMSAQIELMTTTRILQPLKKSVLKRLQLLIRANELRFWFPIYLCLFVLLHSCSILTADEQRQAKKYGLKTRYVYDAFIEELHVGATTMTYYFHYCNKGSHPFMQDWMSEKNLALAELNAEQAWFMEESTALIRDRLLEFQRIRESEEFENDWYFVSQLYDVDWKPKFTTV